MITELTIPKVINLELLCVSLYGTVLHQVSSLIAKLRQNTWSLYLKITSTAIMIKILFENEKLGGV